MRQLTLHVSEKLAEGLKNYAYDTRRSKSEVLRDLIERELLANTTYLNQKEAE